VVLPTELERTCRAALDERDPLAALRAARQLRDSLADWEAHLARSALARGETWETIGAALSISRQAAWERLRRGIASQIESERDRLRAERTRLTKERSKRWPKTP
jgi:hypothetical protein